MAEKRTSRTAESFRSQVSESEPDACPWIDPGPEGENLRVEDFPTFILLRLATAAKVHITRRYLDQFGVSLPEWRLLALVARFSPLPFGEVALRSSMDKGQVSRTLQVIRRKGFVRVNAVNSSKRPRSGSTAPRIEVFVTPKGRALCQKIVPVARKQQMRLLMLMSPKERQTFYSVARRMMELMPRLPDDKN
ncbi:MAG: MarR family winged helix-turn-helix transcriptional regulator [Pseudomonadota bacterium]